MPAFRKAGYFCDIRPAESGQCGLWKKIWIIFFAKSFYKSL